MKIIYVAGPYRNQSESKVLDNVIAAKQVARRLWKNGWGVICPHMNSCLIDGSDIPEERFANGYLEILGRCDAIVLLEGWQRSIGSLAELTLALKLGIQIYYEEKEVPNCEELG